MKQHAIDHFMEDEGFEVWYTTPKQKGNKYRFFETLEALEKWCKRNKGKSHVWAGSWQAFYFMNA